MAAMLKLRLSDRSARSRSAHPDSDEAISWQLASLTIHAGLSVRCRCRTAAWNNAEDNTVGATHNQIGQTDQRGQRRSAAESAWSAAHCSAALSDAGGARRPLRAVPTHLPTDRHCNVHSTRLRHEWSRAVPKLAGSPRSGAKVGAGRSRTDPCITHRHARVDRTQQMWRGRYSGFCVDDAPGYDPRAPLEGRVGVALKSGDGEKRTVR